jgi:hypothetical protein
MIAVETGDLSVRVGVIRNRVEPAAIGAMSAMHSDDKPATNYLAFVKLAYEFTPQLVCA